MGLRRAAICSVIWITDEFSRKDQRGGRLHVGLVCKFELPEAVYVWINGNVIVGNLVPGPSAIVAEYAGAPAGPGYDVWREDVCRNFCRMRTLIPAPPAK